MALEKILVGDDKLDFARKNFPFIPGADVDFVADPEQVIQRARTGEYQTIVTDLQYTEGGYEGFGVLEALREVDARKILWTGNANDKGVRERAQALGAEVLDKDEIGTLVGQVVNRAPLKQGGKVLIYVTRNDQSVFAALKKTTALFFEPSQVTVSSDLRGELGTGEYGLVIDTSTMIPRGEGRASIGSGAVAHDMKYLRLREAPRVVTLPNITTAVADIARIAGDYLRRVEQTVP